MFVPVLFCLNSSCVKQLKQKHRVILESTWRWEIGKHGTFVILRLQQTFFSYRGELCVLLC